MLASSKFTDADKEACLPVIDLIIECSNTARRDGVLALETFVQKQGNDFLTFGAMLVVDGTDPENVRDILETLINADNHAGSALLERMLILEGVLSIQAGARPPILILKLLSMLGERYLRQAGFFPVTPPDKVLNQRLDVLSGKVALPESAAFDRTIQDLSNQKIQRFLMETDVQVLAASLLGCGEESARKLLNNVSTSLAIMVLEDMERIGDINDVIVAQTKILKAIEKLESNEILSQTDVDSLCKAAE